MNKISGVEEWDLPFLDRYFDEHVIKPEDKNQCWLWKGPHNDKGYPNIWFRDLSIKAHRYSFERFNKQLLGKLQCCHKCDNKGCVNPEHLFAGTNTENMRDLISKGKLPQGKLSMEKAQEIRRLAKQGVNSLILAAQFGISQRMVNMIRKHQVWK